MPPPISLPAAKAAVIFIGSSREDLRAFPEDVRRSVGVALLAAQVGGKDPHAKPLTGDKKFKGATILEVSENYDGDTYRAVYTVRFAGFVYVLHAFQKKSKHGVSTPAHEIARVKSRLARAEVDYKQRIAKSA